MESFLFVYFPMVFASLAFAYFALHGKPKQLQKILWILSALPPICVAAFRYNNGADYLMYDRMYHSFLSTGDFVSIKSIEIGFKWLIQFCQLFSSKSLPLFIVCAILIVSFYYKGIIDISADSKSVLVGLVLFYATGTYFDSFNGLRQYLAAAIIFWGFQFIPKADLKKWVGSVCFAFLFHYTAIVMLPAYFIHNFKFSIKRSFVIIFSAVFGGAAVYRFVTWGLQFTRYSYFLASVEYEIMPTEASTFYTIVITVIAFFVVSFSGNCRFSKLTKKENILLNMQTLTVCTALLSWSVPLMWRLQYYFLPMEMIIIPSFIRIERKKLIQKILTVSIIIMYTIVVMYGILVNGWFDCIPWNFYFNSV